MDLQTAVLCIGIVVALAVLLLLIFVFGIKEKTYEEAIAEQQRKDEEMLLQKKSDKVPKDKKHKKWGRKSKEKGDKGIGEDELHVGFKSEAEIIPEEKDKENGKKASPSGSKGSKRLEEPKSILIVKKEKEKSPPAGKEDVDLTTNGDSPKDDAKEDTANAPVKSAASVKESSPKSESPKDARPAADKKEKTAAQPKKDESKPADTKESKKKELPEEEIPKKVEVPEVQNEPPPPPPPKERSKERELKASEERTKKEEVMQTANPTSPGKKPKKPKLDDEVLSSARLTNIIKSSVLSHGEIQSLIETLLNKQQTESGENEWSKIGQKIDPIATLRKQLQEKEEALTEERQRALATGNTLKSIRQELNSERSGRLQLERAIKEHQQECQNLHAQLQRSSSEVTTHKVKIQQLQAKLQEEANVAQSLKNENSQLQQTLGQIESGSNSLQNENETLCADLEQIKIQYQQLQELVCNLQSEKKDSCSAYEQTVADLKNQLVNAEDEKAALQSELHNAHITCGAIERDKESLQQQVGELQNDLQIGCEAHNRMLGVVEELKEQKAAMEVQVISLHNQLQEINSRLMISDQELLALKELNELSPKVAEREEAEGQEGGDEGVTCDKTNGHVQLEESGEQTKMLLSEHEHIMHEKEKIVDQLTSELEDKEHAAQELVNQVNDLKGEIVRLNAEIEKQRAKNNELREKNWKIMEALKQAENALNDYRKQAEKLKNEAVLEIRTEEQKATQDVLQRIFPLIRIETSADHLDWVSQFEKQALQVFEAALSPKQNDGEADELRSRLEASEEACNKLQAQVLHYKTSLVETEGILKKIQGSVEEEELKWKEKLEAKEQQLEKLLEEKRSYEEGLEQVRAAEEAAVEMQEKLGELKEKLQSEENERRLLEVQRLESKKVASGLREQLQQAEDQLQQWKLEREEFSERAKEANVLREELESERRSLGELRALNVKLESQIKIGVESVRQEQEMVKLLEAKLEAQRSDNTIVPATNGPPPTDCDASNLESSHGGADSNQWPNPSLSAAAPSASSLLYMSQQPSPAHSTTAIIAANSTTTTTTTKKPKNKKRAASVKK